jgi:DivIVA domain-containing protein
MDSPQPPAPSILDTLRSVEFRLSLKGYHVDEVDEYLEKAAVEAEALQEHLRQSTERLRQASERIAQLEAQLREAPPVAAAEAPPLELANSDESLQRTLLLAQKFVDQTKQDSEAEAARLIAQADEQARTTVAQAEERARQLSAEAEQRLRDEVGRLEAMRAQLAGDVETMARHLESERNRIRSALSEVLKWVDENVQPANSLMAMRPRNATAEGRPNAPAAPRPPGPRPAPNAAPDQPGAPGATANGGGTPGADTVAQVLDLRGSPPAERG